MSITIYRVVIRMGGLAVRVRSLKETLRLSPSFRDLRWSGRRRILLDLASLCCWRHNYES